MGEDLPAHLHDAQDSRKRDRGQEEDYSHDSVAPHYTFPMRLLAADAVTGSGWDLALFWLVAGGLAGWLASLLARTGDRMGCLLNVVVGIVGAVIGGWVFRSLHWRVPAGHPFWPSVFVAFVGATILLLILRLLARLAKG